jgi:hypothetical protein
MAWETILETPHPALDGRPPLRVPTAFEYLSEPEYQQLRDAALKLIKVNSPRETYFVGVGAAARPLVSVLRQLGSNVATHLPLEWSEGSYRMAQKQVQTAFMDRKAVRNSEVFQSLDAALPAGALRGDRKIVVFRPTRPTHPGGLLEFAKGATANYLCQTNAPQVVVQSVALAEKMPHAGVRWLDSKSSPEVRQLNLPKYRFLAERDAKGYAVFEKALVERLRADPLIAQVVARLAAKQPITDLVDSSPASP